MSNLSDLPASPVAREISARFDVLMRRGGRIDQILAGGVGQRPPALPDAEVERILQNLETQLSEYKVAIREANSWHENYKKRYKNSGFRCLAVSRKT